MAFERSQWIWHNSYRGVNVYVNLEDSFSFDASPSGCRIRISCDTNYALWLNGHFVDCGQYADYEDMKVYDELNLSGLVKPGKNMLLITVYYQNQSSSTYRHGEPGLIYEITADGTPVCVSSQSTYTYKNSAFGDGASMEQVSGQLGFTFHYDSTCASERKERKHADLVSKTRVLHPRPVKKLVIHDPAPAKLIYYGDFCDTVSSSTPAKKMQVASLFHLHRCGKTLKLDNADYKGVNLICEDENEGICAIIDLGEENTGFLSLDIELAHACDIFIGWGEHLTDLRVRTSIGERSFAALFRAEAGRNRFENPLFRCGARYIQLHIYSKRCTLYYAGLRSTLYPLDKIAPFKCADHIHEKIYNVSVRTLLLCMHEHYEDCPWREQALYSMDSRNQMLCGYFAFGETQFPRASIELMAHSIRDDNMLELCSPAEVWITIPSFSAIFLTQLFEYLYYSNDTEFVRVMLPTAERIAEAFIRRIEGNGLIKCYSEDKYWNFYEWQDGLEGSIYQSIPEEARTFDAPLNAFVSMGLRSLADICERLGASEKAEYFRMHHRKLNKQMNCKFFDAVRGCYASFLKSGTLFHYCELTNALLVCADAVPKERIDGVLDKLAGGGLLPVTLSHSIFKYDALMRNATRFARQVFNEVAQIWGSMLTKDATTFWETIEGESAFDNAGTLCHGWSAIPAYLYLKYALKLPPSLTGIYEARLEE